MWEFFRKKQEVVPAPTPSSFVLIQNGEERILASDEIISLKPSIQDSEEDTVKSFQVRPNSRDLSLMIHWKSGHYVNSKWGPNEGKIKIGLRPVAFTQQDEKSYIKGSCMYFDKENMCLHGDGWTLEFRPKK